MPHDRHTSPNSFGALRAAAKLDAAARAALAEDDASVGGVGLLRNSTEQLRALLVEGQGRDETCRTRLTVDDETFYKRQPPWPTKLCG